MYDLNKKELLIIKTLINSKNYVSSEVLATIAGSNPKSVREYIQNISLLLSHFMIRIKSQAGQGYFLTYDDFDEYYTFVSVFREKYPDDSQMPYYNSYRIEYLIRKLLRNNYVKASQMAEELYISSTTLSNDMKVVKEIIGKYHLKLINRPNYGYRLEGGEGQIRMLISRYLYGNEISDDEDDQSVSVVVDNEEIFNKLSKGLQYYDIHVSARAFDDIVSYIIVSMSRFEAGYRVGLSLNEINEIEDLEDSDDIRKIVLNIWPDGPRVEIANLVIFIQSLRVYGTDDRFNKKRNQALYELSSRIRTFVAGCTQQSLIMDEECCELLPRVLKSMFLRIRYHYEIKDCPVIKTKNSQASFYICALICYFIERERSIKIPEEEIVIFTRQINESLTALIRQATITRRDVCLVTAGGRNEALTYANILKRDYSDYIRSIRLMEYYELNDKNSDFDVLITDLSKSKFNVSVPIFQTKFMLGAREHRRVVNLLSNKESRRERFISCFSKELYVSKLTVGSKEELLEMAGDFFEKKYSIYRIKDYLQFQDQLISSEIGNAVALCHSFFTVCDETKITIVTLKHPVIWKHELVSVVFFVLLGNENKLCYSPLRELCAITRDSILVHNILQSSNYDDSLKLLSDGYEMSNEI